MKHSTDIIFSKSTFSICFCFVFGIKYLNLGTDLNYAIFNILVKYDRKSDNFQLLNCLQ